MSVGRSKLQFLESILKSNGMLIRYEKGHFQSGYCILKERKVAIINKFYKTPARTRILKEIIKQIGIDPQRMSKEEMEILDKMVPEWRKVQLFASEVKASA